MWRNREDEMEMEQEFEINDFQMEELASVNDISEAELSEEDLSKKPSDIAH